MKSVGATAVGTDTQTDAEGAATSLSRTMTMTTTKTMTRGWAQWRQDGGPDFPLSRPHVTASPLVTVSAAGGIAVEVRIESTRTADSSTWTRGVIQACLEYLREAGFPAPLVNALPRGAEALYRVEAAAYDQGVIRKVLISLSALFEDDSTRVSFQTAA